MGGPGSIFWMWITAIIGMSTKFFTCTLAVMYRGVDDRGEIQGGVMYFIEEGLGNLSRCKYVRNFWFNRDSPFFKQTN